MSDDPDSPPHLLLWPLLFDGQLKTDANYLHNGYGRGYGYGYGGYGYGYGFGRGYGNGRGNGGGYGGSGQR